MIFFWPGHMALTEIVLHAIDYDNGVNVKYT